MRHWHVVFTRPRQERQALMQLQRQGYEAWLPLVPVPTGKRRAGPAQMPLFPRYLFVHVDSAVENTAPIRSTIGCCGLVRFGQELAALPGQIVENLRRRCEDSVSLPAMDWRRGDCLKIKSGPFAGLEAIFQARTGQERVAVLLTWLGMPRQAQVPAELLVAVDH
jgi:transcriptional antiterminator RfaH